MTADELWREFCNKVKIDAAMPYEAWSFGGGDCPDDYSVLLRMNGEAACVIRNYDVYIRPFESVPPFHAYAEGEADRSLESWRDIHTRFFRPGLESIGKPLTAKSLIVCEKFTVEYTAESGVEEADELFFVEPSLAYAKEIIAYRNEMLEADSGFDWFLIEQDKKWTLKAGVLTFENPCFLWRRTYRLCVNSEINHALSFQILQPCGILVGRQIVAFQFCLKRS